MIEWSLESCLKYFLSGPSPRRSDSQQHLSQVLNHTPKSYSRSDQIGYEPKTLLNPPPRHDTVIDPALSEARSDRTQDQGYKAAIKAWSRFRFVRAGWFTPSEAVEYID